jgi:hypothetical protein
MTAAYTLLLRNAYGKELAILDDFSSLQYSKSLNGIGSLFVTLPDRYPTTLFGPDYRIEIWRTPIGGQPYYEMNTFWLIRDVTVLYTPEGNGVSLECVDLMDILKRRLVAATRNTDNGTKSTGRGTSDYADNLMRDFVRENMGAGATDTLGVIDRQISGLTIEPNLTTGYGPANTEIEASYIPVLDVLNQLAEYSESQGTKLYFNMIGEPIDGTDISFYVTKDRLGADRTLGSGAPIVFSWEFGNLAEVEMVEAYADSRTAVYALGPGSQDARTVRRADSANITYSPFSRIEQAESWTGSDEDDTNDLMDAFADSQVYRYAARALVTASVNDQIGYAYGRDYQYGDLVTVMSESRRFDCLVRSVGVSAESGQETVDIVLEGSEVI